MSASDLHRLAASQLNKWWDTYGDEVAEKTQFIGHDSSEYRKSVNLPPVDRDLQNKHNVFIHDLGADVLRSMLDEEKQQEMEREALLKNRYIRGSGHHRVYYHSEANHRGDVRLHTRVTFSRDGKENRRRVDDCRVEFVHL